MKFINLLKKELSELLTAQMLMGIVLIFLVFMFLGSFMQDAVNEEAKAVTAISTTGSLHPDSPTPLSSDESSFFIHSSGESLFSVPASSAPLYCKYPFYYIFFRGIRKYMG